MTQFAPVQSVRRRGRWRTFGDRRSGGRRRPHSQRRLVDGGRRLTVFNQQRRRRQYRQLGRPVCPAGLILAAGGGNPAHGGRSGSDHHSAARPVHKERPPKPRNNQYFTPGQIASIRVAAEPEWFAPGDGGGEGEIRISSRSVAGSNTALGGPVTDEKSNLTSAQGPSPPGYSRGPMGVGLWRVIFQWDSAFDVDEQWERIC